MFVICEERGKEDTVLNGLFFSKFLPLKGGLTVCNVAVGA